MRRAVAGVVVFGCLLAAACGGKAGTAVKPPEFSANEALKSAAVSCAGKPSSAAPFVIDLDSSIRADLEAQMKQGVVIVGYDCKSIKVLSSCQLSKTPYEYAGVQRIEEVVQLKTQDDLAANLPFASGKLGGEINSGRTLDLATVLVGKKTTIIRKPKHAELIGECDGATHYVASATVGAYSLAKGQVGKVVAAAEVFKIGANASSEASEKRAKNDGSLDSCKTSDPDSDAPPKECRAPLRLELRPFLDAPSVEAEGHAHKAAKKDASEQTKDKEKEKDKEKARLGGDEVESPCPEGFVFSSGACTKAGDAPHLCNPKNKEECKQQCEKGSGESCFNYARKLKKVNPIEHASWYKKSCDLNFAQGCADYALFGSPLALYDNDEFSKKYEKEWRESLAAAQKGCNMGNGEACSMLGQTLDTDVEFDKFKDVVASHKAYERACKLGDGEGCGVASANLRNGTGVTKDLQKSVDLLERACSGGVSDSCNELSEILHEGTDGVPKNQQRAFELSAAQCLKAKDMCFIAAKSGMAIKKDDKLIFGFLKTDCEGGWNGESCSLLADFHAKGRGTMKDASAARALWKKLCDEYQDDAACGKIGKGAKPAPKPKAAKKK